MHIQLVSVRVRYVPLLSGPLTLRVTRSRDEKSPGTIGEHVRERRKSLGLTQVEAAERIGVGRDALARWEVDRTGLDVRSVPKVIEFLGYDPQPPSDTFRDLLRQTRRGLGLSQAEFADVIGVPMNTLHGWELGRNEPGAKRRTAIETQIATHFGTGCVRRA